MMVQLLIGLLGSIYLYALWRVIYDVFGSLCSRRVEDSVTEIV